MKFNLYWISPSRFKPIVNFKDLEECGFTIARKNGKTETLIKLMEAELNRQLMNIILFKWLSILGVFLIWAALIYFINN